MSSLRKIQLLAIGVILNSLAAMAFIASTDAQAAACGNRFDCTSLNCNNPFWAQAACYANLPAGCAATTPLACYEGGSASCPFMVLCQDL